MTSNQKKTLSWIGKTQVTATADPYIKFTAPVGFTPVDLRLCTTASRGDADETYVLSMEDDGTKISTDNAAVTADGYNAIVATFASGTKVAKDSVVEIILTLGGTTPTLDDLIIILSYYED